jgi:glycine cleavage system protein P-like pyridoxal-binding family
VLGGLVLSDVEPDDAAVEDALLVCATEVTTSDDIARFADALESILRGRPPVAVEAGAGADRAAVPAEAR